MKHLLLGMFVLCFATIALAQNGIDNNKRINNILQEIVKNNTQLKAQHQQMKAQILANGAELRLSDPDVDVAYSLNTPDCYHNKTNISISQPLDWDVITGKRKLKTKATNTLAERSYQKQIANVINEADETIVNVIYYNILCNELTKRTVALERLLKLYTQKYEKGDATAIELNKVKLNVSMSKAELKRAQSERKKATASLRQLNGGVAITINDTTYFANIELLPSLNNLQVQQSGNSSIAIAKANIDVSERNLSIAKILKYPTLKVGFQGEYNGNERYSGLSFGFTLPLWGNNRKRIKQAEAQVLADQQEVFNLTQQLNLSLKMQYEQVTSLANIAQELQTNLNNTSSSYLLQRSLDSGHISLIDYMLEESFFYTARTALLDAQHDAQLAMAKLRGMFR